MIDMSKCISLGDATIDIDDRIEYTQGSPGSPRGKLSVVIKSPVSNISLTKSITWDSINRTEVDALYTMKIFLANLHK